MNYGKIIKKYLGIVGFILAFIGLTIYSLYKFYGKEVEPLGEIFFFVWIATWTISSEIKKNLKSGGYIQSQYYRLQQLILRFLFIHKYGGTW